MDNSFYEGKFLGFAPDYCLIILLVVIEFVLPVVKEKKRKTAQQTDKNGQP